MEITVEKLTEELVITPDEMQEVLADMDKQLTQERAFDILFGIVEQTQEEIKKEKEKNGTKEPIPLVKLMWIARQSFLMGVSHGLDLYNEVVKGFIANFSGGVRNNTLYLYRSLRGKITLLRGYLIYV